MQKIEEPVETLQTDNKETTLYDGPFAELKEQNAKFEEFVKTLPQDKALLARCRWKIRLAENCFYLPKKEKVMISAKTIEETNAIPVDKICDFLVKQDVLENISSGYIRQVLPDRYKNANQGRIANLQLKGIAASRERWDKSRHPKRYVL